MYTPLAQEPEAPSWMNFELRTAQDPASLAPAAMAAARSVSKDVVIRYVRTMEQQVNASLIRERLLATLSGGFAVLALLLAAVGLYGVMSYSVSRRGREIGIRMALGARRGNVLWQVLRQTLVVSAIGILIGVSVVLVSARYVSTLLFGLSERDPLTLASVALMLFCTAMIAGFFPARRAGLSRSGHRHQVGIGLARRLRPLPRMRHKIVPGDAGDETWQCGWRWQWSFWSRQTRPGRKRPRK